ncbi:MAG: hypothetical protein ACR2OZ_04215 [Verrucomicrobiales bacterium]
MNLRPFLLMIYGSLSLAQAGGVYWTDRGASQLKRMNFDGTGLQTITLSGGVTVSGTNIRGIAVDVPNGRLFWADNGADRLLRANLDGSSSMILHTITGGNSFPADVRLDLANGHFYWCDQLRDRIQRSSLDGSAVADVITDAAPAVGDGPYFMELDIPAGKIYWGDFNGGHIFRANLDGASREMLVTGNNLTRGVCLDAAHGMLYWINRDDKKVHRCPLSAFGPLPIPPTPPVVETLYSGLDTPHGLVLDIPARKLYWADTGSNSGTGTGDKAVSRGDFDGSGAVEVLGTGSEPWDVDLDRRCANYADWVARCFRQNSPAALTDPAADPDGDGVINALEYAKDLSPVHSELGTLQGFITVGPVTNSEYHALKFRRRSGTTDLAYYPQVSTDLINWRDDSTGDALPPTIEIEVTPLGDGMEEVTARTLYTINDIPHHFMRLRVVMIH